MKRLIFKNLMLGIVWVITSTYCLSRPDYEEKKQVNKTYQITAVTKVSFTNSFGMLHVNTWDKNELQVNVLITVRSSNEDRAKEMLDRIRIDIDDASPAAAITFKTVISSSRMSGNNSMQIDYTVNMPKNNTLDLRNSFGDCYLADYSGPLTINESYGNLKTETLSGNSDIDLSFGSGTSNIAGIKSGQLKVGYSTLGIGSAGSVDLNSQFSNLTVDKISGTTLVAKYGQVDFGEVGAMDATVNFSSFGIRKLNNRLKLDISYAGKTDIENISSEIQSIAITSSFGPVSLDLPSGLNANIHVATEFGNLNYNESKVNFNKIHEGTTSKDYEGRIGNGSSSVLIQVNEKYGDVKINQD